MYEPTSMSNGSVMPPYTCLFNHEIDTKIMPAKIRAMQKLVVPYPTGYDSAQLQIWRTRQKAFARALLQIKFK